MTTEKNNLAPQSELVGNTAEDAQKTTTTEVNGEQMLDNETTTNAMTEEFADEEAALAAEEAGLEIGEETEEEAEAASHNDSLLNLSQAELVALLAQKLDSEPVQTLRPVVEAIKIAFYKQHRAKVEAERKAFIEQGGNDEEFTPTTDNDEVRFKELFAVYRSERDRHIAELEASKEQNLKLKLEIIEELKELINSDENTSSTFARFRELQSKWKEIGLVPQHSVKDLWETYNLHVENFYNYIKINRELRS